MERGWTLTSNLTLDSLKTLHEWVPKTPTDKAILFDCEADGLLDTATKVHCIVCEDVSTGERFSAHTPSQLREAVHSITEAPVIVAHNAIRYDVPLLEKIYGVKPIGRVFDTLVAMRLLYGDGDDFKTRDFDNIRRKKYELPGELIGRHKLEAWGYRLGKLKGAYGKTANWAVWTPEMQTYCEGDVDVLKAVYNHTFAVGFSAQAIDLEMRFAAIIHRQIEYGFPFDVPTAERLYAELCGERAVLLQELRGVFPPKREETVFIPKRNNKTKGYVKDVPFLKVREVPFNPSSRAQVAERLKELHGWEPVEYTPTGEPKIDDDILKALPYPEAGLLAKWFERSKVIGMVSEGKNGWLKMVAPDGRIHGDVNTNGAVTGRCTHSRPNLAQVPKSGEYGPRCRACFAAPPGWVMVGADASGLELRMFAHFVARYDGGKYTSIVLDGDVHTTNQKAAGLPSRDTAKTFISTG